MWKSLCWLPFLLSGIQRQQEFPQILSSAAQHLEAQNRAEDCAKSLRLRAPCDSSSQRAGLARVPPPPHPWEARLAGGARANKAGGACGRIPGPIARWRGRSPGGEKESAAESKRLVGGRLPGSGSPGLSLYPGSERDSGRSPCTHPVAVAEPSRLAQEVEPEQVIFKSEIDLIWLVISGHKVVISLRREEFFKVAL
ncbi:hypothetical protein ACRRTK_018711 [Alexandromys fortis]